MAKVTQDFRYTGGAQTFTVPAYVTSVLFELWGAPGGSGNAIAPNKNGLPGATGAYAYNNGYSKSLVQNGGFTKTLVGYVAGTLAVTPGDTYTVTVGGSGGYGNDMDIAAMGATNYGPGGYNGGGNGGYVDPNITSTADPTNSYGVQRPGCGGGGATDIRHSGTALSNRILVAGGGGGSGGQGFLFAGLTATANPETPDPPFTDDLVPGSGDHQGPNYFPTAGPQYGGAGGGVTGGTGGGASRSPANIPTAGGRGGSQTAGGAGGASTGTWSNAGAAGASGSGGHGGNVATSDYTGSSGSMLAGGGGGGGGYFGGGGGAGGSVSTNGSLSGGGGGGGSNYVSGSFTGGVSYQHVPPAGEDSQTGVNGYARLTYTQPPNPPSVTTINDLDYINTAEPLTVAWDFSSLADGATQGGFDVGYSVHGTGSWTLLLHPTSTTPFLEIPAGTFTGGTNYDIRVRVYDQNGDVSDYTIIEVQAIAVPHAPTITSPADGSTLSTNPFTVTWTVDAGVTETIYRVKAMDSSGAVQVDSGDLYSTRVNACTNPSFESSTAGWTTSGGCSLAQSTTYSVVPTHSGKVTWATGVAGTQGVAFGFPTIPGKTYTCSAFVTVATPGTDPDILFQALDIDKASQLGVPQTVHVVTAGSFLRGSTTFVAQSTTSYFVITNATDATAGQVCYVDAALIEYGTNLNGYFDGSNANGNPGTASWQGATNLSNSLLTVANVLSYSVNWPLPSQPITVTVEYADTTDLNLYSPAAVSNPVVNLNPPDVPDVNITISNDNGTVTLAITNPPGTFTALKNEVYRQDLTNNTPEVLMATLDPNTNWTDYTVVTQTLYAYRVRAYSADGGFADAT